MQITFGWVKWNLFNLKSVYLQFHRSNCLQFPNGTTRLLLFRKQFYVFSGYLGKIQVFISSITSVVLFVSDRHHPSSTHTLGTVRCEMFGCHCSECTEKHLGLCKRCKDDTSELFCWNLVLCHPIKAFKTAHRFLQELLSFICKVGSEFTEVGRWFIYS